VKNYDLASLTKPLITAPLALSSLNLDEDYTSVLGFNDSTYRLTPRALLPILQAFHLGYPSMKLR